MRRRARLAYLAYLVLAAQALGAPGPGKSECKCDNDDATTADPCCFHSKGSKEQSQAFQTTEWVSDSPLAPASTATPVDQAAAASADQKGGAGSSPSVRSTTDPAQGKSASTPNILLVLVDDQGYGDISYTDSAMHTPYLEQIAKKGVILDSFYSASTCTPARTMLMTGRYTIRSGMQDSVIHSTEPRGVPLSEQFLSEKLESAGYTTVAIGKWHLGMHMPQYVPLKRGFDSHYGILTGGGSHTKHLSVSQSFAARGQDDTHVFSGLNLWEMGHSSPDNHGEVHSTFLYSKKALQVVEALSGKGPWFMYLAYQAVHDPIEVGSPESISMTSCGQMDTNTTGEERPVLCGMMAEVDNGVGALQSKLLELGDWDNTVLIYASDNGGLQSHGSSNGPFSGEKGTYWEGGVHVPAFIAGGYMTTALKANNVDPYVSTALSHITDIHSTILGLVQYDGATAAAAPDFSYKLEDLKLDGTDMWSYLVAPDSQHHGSYWARSEVLINANSALFGNSGALRQGDYKYIVNPDPMESTIYSKVKKYIQATTDEVEEPEATLRSYVLSQAKKHLDGSAYLFNIVKNPSERTDGDCDDIEACTNLLDNAAFAHIQAKIVAAFGSYQDSAAESTFEWADDGALAHPAMFNGLWSPWRDEDGEPLSSYLGLSRGTLQDHSVVSDSTDAEQGSAQQQMASLSGSWSPPGSVSKIALTTSAIAGIVAVALAAFKAGQRHEYRRFSL